MSATADAPDPAGAEVPGPAPVMVTIVHAPACHLCEDAEAAVRELAADHRVEIRRVDIRSTEGLRLVATHRQAMNPLVLLDGEFFSAGRLPRGKLRKALRRAATPTGSGPGSDTGSRGGAVAGGVG